MSAEEREKNQYIGGGVLVFKLLQLLTMLLLEPHLRGRQVGRTSADMSVYCWDT